MFREKPDQHAYYGVRNCQAGCTTPVAAPEPYVSTREQPTTKQCKQTDQEHHDSQRFVASAFRRLFLTEREVPRINRFKVNWLAVKRRCLNVNFVLRLSDVDTIPGRAFVVGVERYPGRRDGLEVFHVQASGMKSTGPVSCSTLAGL